MNGLVRRATAWALRLRLVRALLLYTERRGAMLADSITYRALFSIFAAVLLGFSLAALWLGGDPEALRALRDALERVLPGLSKVVDPTSVRAPVGFTVVGALSLIGLVGAAISAIGSLRTALRALSDELHDDGFFLWTLLRNLLVGVAFGGLLIVAAVLGVAASTGVEAVSGWLGWSARSAGAVFAARGLGILIVFAIDLAAIALAFRLLSGVRAPARALWTGAALGALALTILQELSGLFVRGAAANPLLATFAALIALLLWVNLSVQAILIASSYIITATAETHDRVRLRYGAETFAQRRRQQAEDRVRVAKAELRAAQEAEREEREGIRPADDPRE
ncbi:ribonuclease BN [Leucobacter sp. OLJS4]|uniref:YihY/virulence factor BrkB family protein n=1 Tax=unclassified Leucobacter TaxID=2621730 RepID=UPI000C46CF8A|nr:MULTISPECIES: YihY/virulence factor BrkB family protein [unclassified Leucobacter]PII81534.1 ribonuclease BN [Leucobacter sp. OLCALW19]PII86206.1 ribonuclease BN [Leucobacter sp. OLTLW20]PII90101.1 ribonuclease BN [Leucobacter sp. OLAS13]PII97134.1 ribonuclease BN [Leucobacter sp. OLDS2]PIJ02172.1 ribonuclease BN [Leucobacter sp. OLIS6]